MIDPIDTLPPHLAALVKSVVASREAQGLNVHFINAMGERDRYSFQTTAQRDAFTANLKRLGLTILHPTAGR